MSKTIKRDRAERAWKRGYQCGLHGNSQLKCPHETLDLRGSWLSGWRDGYHQRLNA